MFDDQLDEETVVEEDISSTYLTFDLGDQTLGVEVRHVREIIDPQKITRLPNAPMDVLGVVDVRGTSVPIIDLRARLGLPHTEFGGEERIVVLEIGPDRKPLGVEADRVRNVDQITAAEIEPVPGTGAGSWDARVLQGLWRRGDDLVVLVDLDRILGSGDEIDLSAGHGIF